MNQPVISRRIRLGVLVAMFLAIFLASFLSTSTSLDVSGSLAKPPLLVLAVEPVDDGEDTEDDGDGKPTKKKKRNKAKRQGDDEDDSRKRKRKKKKKKKTRRNRYEPEPRASNLVVPDDLSKDQMETVQKALDAYNAALKAINDPEENFFTRVKLIKRAQKSAGRATERVRDCAVAHFCEGRLHLNQFALEKAEESLNRAVELKPDFFEAWLSLADLQMDLKNFEEALATYDRTLELYPGFLDALHQKGVALLALGRFKEARRTLKEAQRQRKDPLREIFIKRARKEIKGTGWKNEYVSESTVYRVYTPISQAYADQMTEQLELMMKMFRVLFPKIKKPDRKYDVWVHADRRKYVEAGGPGFAAGHFDQYLHKIELWRQPSLAETVQTLNHEGFHLFIADYAPHMPQWLNEGLGDYFSPFERVGNKMIPQINRKRVGACKSHIQRNRCTPATELMVMSIREMYNPRSIGVHYAQAWGMVYYCMSKEGQKHKYKALLKKYVGLVFKGSKLEEAYAKTFAKINMDKFEQRWKSYIMKL